MRQGDGRREDQSRQQSEMDRALGATQCGVIATPILAAVVLSRVLGADDLQARIAAQSLLGRDFRITRQRGELVESAWAERLICTWHPSAVLRAPDEVARRRMREELFLDLHTAAKSLMHHARHAAD